MKLVGTLHTFNTGRRYAASGQPITWAIIERADGQRVVVFSDVARGIGGSIPLFVGNLDLITDAWVLRAYDDYHYSHAYLDVQFLTALIHTAPVA